MSTQSAKPRPPLTSATSQGQRDVVIQNTFLTAIYGAGMVLLALLGLGAAWLGFYGFTDLSRKSDPSAPVWLYVSLPFAGVLVAWAAHCFACFRAQRPGIVVSPTRNRIEFPGGGLAAASVGDWFSWSWLTQSWRRYSEPLDSIIAINGSTVTTTRETEWRVSSTSANDISLTFESGIVTFTFGGNEAKRDQLYNVLRVVNRMGTPVFEA